MTSATVNPVPDSYPVVTPLLAVEGAAAAIDFYCQVFGAEEKFRYPGPDGTVMFAEVSLGGRGLLMVSEADAATPGPLAVGASSVTIAVYVPDVDATVEAAVAAGAEVTSAVSDRPDGDRVGVFRDPFGHLWAVASRVEDLSHDEMVARVAQAYRS